MARIPLGDFGNVVARPAPAAQVPDGAFDSASGVRQLANTGMGLAAQAMQEQRQTDLLLKRAEAVNTQLDREIEVKKTVAEVEREMFEGRLHYSDAAESFRQRLSVLPVAETANLDPVTAANLARGMKRVDASASAQVDGAIEKAKVSEYKGQADLAIDNLLKLGGMPGADTAGIAARITAIDPMGQVAYGKNWPSKKQETIDRLYYNEAAQRVVQNRENLDGLKALEAELSDGYGGKIDTDKRTQLMRSVSAYRIQLENRQQHQAAVLEKRAEAAINEIDRQISSGVPATPEMWARWSTITNGTTQREAFNDRINAEAEVQRVLRQPIDQQQAFVQQREAQLLTAGGSVRDKANVERLAAAVKANTDKLENAPLLFAQTRTGQAPAALDVAALLQPGGAGALADAFASRRATNGALQAEYGDRVKTRLLLPAEVKMATAMLDKATPQQATQLFGQLYSVIGDDASYRAVMQQIAPDSPVKAFAGMLMAKQRTITLQDNWIRDDVTATSGNVGEIMLSGETLLNKTRGQKAEDGAARGFPLPPEKEFNDAFSRYVGNAFAGRGDSVDSAKQAVRAYYTGKAAKDGDVSGEVKPDRMKEAIRSVLGEMVNFNGAGDTFAPWGMDKSTFKDRAYEAMLYQMKVDKVPQSTINNVNALGLIQYKDGQYFIHQGRNYVHGADGNPVLIDLYRRPNAQSASGKIKAK